MGDARQVEEGLATVAEALRLMDKNDERFYEAELYRIKGELLLAQEGLQRFSGGCDPIATMPKPAENIVQGDRREGCCQGIKYVG